MLRSARKGTAAMFGRGWMTVLAALVVAPAAVHAQDADTVSLDAPAPGASDDTGEVPPPPPDEGAAPPVADDLPVPDAGDDFRLVDAGSTRVMLTPTAETHPEGTVYFTSHALGILGYQLLVLQFGYAITDHVQLSLTGMPPLFEGQPYFFEGAVEGNVVRNETMRLAGMAAFDLLVLEDDTFWGARLSGVGTLCFGETCQSNVSAGLGAIVNDDVVHFAPFAFHLGAIARVSDVVALLAEPIFVGVLGDETEVANGMILGYGVRLSGARWALDIGFMKLVPFQDSTIDDGTILGWPVLSFTYRTEGDAADGGGAPGPAPAPSPMADGTPRATILRSIVGL